MKYKIRSSSLSQNLTFQSFFSCSLNPFLLMAISILCNAISSILKFIANIGSRNKHVTSTTSDIPSSLSEDSSHLHCVRFFMKDHSGTKVFTLDPETGIVHKSFVPDCANNHILAHSNGLVFCKSEEVKGSICVYDPTKKSRRLILPQHATENLEKLVSFFGLSTVYNGDMSEYYRLVLVFPTKAWNDEAYFRVYESKNDAWIDKRIIDIGSRNIQWESSVVCGENIFWVSDCGEYMRCKPYIVGLSLESENSYIVHIPEDAMVIGTSNQYKIWITKWDENALCTVFYDKSDAVFSLWEIKFVPLPQWKLIQKISLVAIGLEDVKDFRVISNEFLVFFTRSEIYTYNLRTKIFKKMDGFY